MADTFNLSPTQSEIKIIENETSINFTNSAFSAGSDKIETLQSIFGLPPDNLFPETTRKILDSMPICHFMPGIPDFTLGLDLFRIKSAWTENSSGDPSYLDLLKAHGFETPNTFAQGIKVAYLADAFPTDTFTNEYGENFLQGLTDVASQKATEITQMMGTKTVTGAVKKMGKPIAKAATAGAEKMLGKNATQTASNYITDAAIAAMDITKGLINSFNVGKNINLVNRLAAGARIDFPMIWKSSGFQPSYTMTVRLYNPNPRSIADTKKYIVGPIVALMLLAVPITQDGSTFSWPFFHRIMSPGIYDLNPGFISNITVIKGGDQQQISQQQHLGIVDVRIDVGSLFSTMVSGTQSLSQKTRPTVKKYMNAMLNPTPGRHSIYDRQGILKKDEDVFMDSAVAYANQGNRSNAEFAKANQPQTKTDASTEPQKRVLLWQQIAAKKIELAECRVNDVDCLVEKQSELDALLEEKAGRDEEE